MKRICINIACISCCIIIILTSCQSSEPTYTITEPYQYPAVPGTDEWDELWDKTDSMMEVAEALEIPEDILKNMTTYALVETVINYPLAINICAYADIGAGHMEGLNNVTEYFNGLPELYSRPDAIEELDKFTSREYFINNANPLERIFTKTLRRKLEILSEDE